MKLLNRALAAAALSAVVLLAGAAAAQSVAPPVSNQPVLMMVHVRVTDMARSERFYRDVFGMSVTREVSANEHVLRFPGSSPTSPGIILLRTDHATPNGGFLVQAPDIDAVFGRVEAAGGHVARAPHDTPAAVRSGFITDPDGAAIEVMQFIRH